MIIMGLHSSFHSKSHDSSCSIVIDGRVLACVEEERFNRKKSSVGYPPVASIKSCLEIAGLTFDEIDTIVSDGTTYPLMQEKVSSHLYSLFGRKRKVELISQSDCHLWGTFFHSGFEESLVFDVEGVGDNVASKVSLFSRKSGKRRETLLYESGPSTSLGILYTLVTQFLGFEAIEGEYKVMGMAAYGTPKHDFTKIIDFDEDKGEFTGDITRFYSKVPQTSIAEVYADIGTLELFFRTSSRRPSSPPSKEHFDIAASLQLHFESLITRFVSYWVEKTNVTYVCLSGGCALNAVANMKLCSLPLSGFFVMPASSDRGVSLGAAVAYSERSEVQVAPVGDMYLGKSYSLSDIEKEVKSNTLKYKFSKNRDSDIACDIERGLIVGSFTGRSEFGPRALGARSILANPRIKGMKDHLNARIKFREEFRPFAPALIQDSVTNPFPFANLEYMTTTIPISDSEINFFPEAVHSDGTSRVQLVSKANHILGPTLLAIGEKTGHPSVINTSFNLRGEPIVESPRDAIRTFFGSGMDVLYLGDIKLSKS